MRAQLYRSTKYRVSNVGNPAIVVNGEEIIIMTRKNLSWSTPTRSFPRKLSVFLFKLRIYFFAYLGKKRKHFKGIQIFQEARKALFLFACLQYLLMFSLHQIGFKSFLHISNLYICIILFFFNPWEKIMFFHIWIEKLIVFGINLKNQPGERDKTVG